MGIATEEPGTAKPNGKGSTRAILAYIVNVSDHPVRVYVPGLDGPILGLPKRTDGKQNPAINPMNNRKGAQFGAGDFVALRPGDMIARQQGIEIPAEHLESWAYYTFYQPGREGRQDGILGVLSTNGTYMRRTD